MAKKLSTNIDYFEGYQLLGLVSHLKDYSLAFFLNQELNINLKKYINLNFDDVDGINQSFSWYCHKDEHLDANFYLICNVSRTGKLMPVKKEIDYFILLKDFPSNEYSVEIVPKIRNIQNVLAVIKLDINSIKNSDYFIENIELQEIKNRKIP
jgi:hypothetical protein